MVGLFRGHAFAIEVKRPGKEPTSLQGRELALIAMCGGAVFVIDGDDGVAELKAWLDDTIKADRFKIEWENDPHKPET